MSIFLDFVCYGADGGGWREEIRDPRACNGGADGGMTHAASCWWGSASRQSREGGVRASEATGPTRQLGTFWPKNNRNTHETLFVLKPFFLSRVHPFTVFRLTLHPSQLAQKKNRNF